MLYPLKFQPILKPKLWGGQFLFQEFGKGTDPNALIGESWEVSSLPGDESIVANGFLEGNTINELIEVYMGDLVGESVYEKYGIELPILVKIIDACKDLSVQVHPDEAFAKKQYKSHGKSELWYVLNAKEEGKIIAGFQKEVSRLDLENAVKNSTVMDLVKVIKSNPTEVYYLPAGSIHALGEGNVVVEIQQASDLTFRIYDYDRTDESGNKRELHVNEALEVIDYKSKKEHQVDYKKELNAFVNLTDSEHFISNLLTFDKALGRDYYFLDSFVVLICTAGAFEIAYEEGETISMKKGETVLLPASIQEFIFTPITKEATFIETYYDK